jgi:hypothetical protein
MSDGERKQAPWWEGVGAKVQALGLFRRRDNQHDRSFGRYVDPARS